jgi:two-component system cell cycle response regulator DivK
MEADRINQKRILIAEDNQDHRIILRHQLHRLGAFAILEATTGQEALDIVVQEAVDLIILNVCMPVLDGWEVARRIRLMPSPARDIPIIAFSAYILSGSEPRARAAGCDEYLAKPILDVMLLKDKVERLLTYGRPGRP